MHLYLLARGLVNHMKEWASELGHQYVPLEIKDKDGKVIKNIWAQVQVRKVELYEVVFPKNSEAAVMGMVNPSEYKVFGKYSNPIKRLTKWMGLKKCLPKDKWKMPGIALNRFISVMPLGTKPDEENWKPVDNPDLWAIGGTPQENL